MKHESGHHLHWSKLALMAAVSFVVMYVLMYMMVDVYANVFPNINQFYMAGVMTGAMMLVEVIVMREMYDHQTLVITGISSVLVFVLCLAGLRYQVGVGDRAFLQSMIPHHGAAVLMCDQAKLTDPEIKNLCQNILKGQQSEIDWMHNKLKTLK